MRQYRAAKDAHPDALLFFRLGDFYELFYEDAVIAARELQLTLTSRDKTKSVPMCGVPYHAAGAYLQRLLRKGYRVALCEQMEDPKTAKTIVRREVTRVLTPGTAVDAALEASQSQWLASVAAAVQGRYRERWESRRLICLQVSFVRRSSPALRRGRLRWMSWRGCDPLR
jgi:DNA mismatch repair protein MutS